MSEQKYMVFDVESIGLYGEGFAVGWVVIDAKGNELDWGGFACPPSKARGSLDGYRWVEENILLDQSRFNCETPIVVRAKFWQRWARLRAEGTILVADCPWPVEANFISSCVNDDLLSRIATAPYPFLDVASAMVARGWDPLAYYERLPKELPVHDPIADARQSARLFLAAINGEPRPNATI